MDCSYWIVPQSVLLVAGVEVLLPRLVVGRAEQLLHSLATSKQRDEQNENLHPDWQEQSKANKIYQQPKASSVEPFIVKTIHGTMLPIESKQFVLMR